MTDKNTVIESEKVEDTLDAMVRDFTEIPPRPKSEVRRRIEAYRAEAMKTRELWEKKFYQDGKERGIAEGRRLAVEYILAHAQLHAMTNEHPFEKILTVREGILKEARSGDKI